MMRKTYDPKCHDLASLFLGDEPALHNAGNISELAALIQQTIEDHIDWLKSERPANSQFGVGS